MYDSSRNVLEKLWIIFGKKIRKIFNPRIIRNGSINCLWGLKGEGRGPSAVWAETLVGAWRVASTQKFATLFHDG